VNIAGQRKTEEEKVTHIILREISCGEMKNRRGDGRSNGGRLSLHTAMMHQGESNGV